MENYWKSGWNRFDLVLVLSGAADMMVSIIGSSHVGALKIQKVMRLMRLARVIKLVRSAKVGGESMGAVNWCGLATRVGTPPCPAAEQPPALCARCPVTLQTSRPAANNSRIRPPQGVRSLFGTLIVSMPAFWNVGALLGLLFYVYAYIGAAPAGVRARGSGHGWGAGLAGSCPRQAPATAQLGEYCPRPTLPTPLRTISTPDSGPLDPGTLLLGHISYNSGLNSHANFKRFWWSLLTLLRVRACRHRTPWARGGGGACAPPFLRAAEAGAEPPRACLPTHLYPPPPAQVATTDNWAAVYEACLVKVRGRLWTPRLPETATAGACWHHSCARSGRSARDGRSPPPCTLHAPLYHRSTLMCSLPTVTKRRATAAAGWRSLSLSRLCCWSAS